jgi:hypothetical protein
VGQHALAAAGQQLMSLRCRLLLRMHLLLLLLLLLLLGLRQPRG